MKIFLFLGLTSMVFGGCTSSYVLGRTAQVAPARSADCKVELLEGAPPRPFAELGVLAPRDIEYGGVAGGATPFVESVRQQVCAVGGDAVVVEKNYAGNYIRGTVIKFR
jgi:hypothetical protein